MKKIYFLFLFTLWLGPSAFAQWTNVGIAFPGTVRGLYFENENTGYAAGGLSPLGYISKTTDGGVTWTSTSFTESTLLRSINFLNEDTGFVCGSGGVVLKTTDAGGTWNVIYTDATQYFRAVDFVSQEVGFLGGALGTILKTTDGGTTWTTYSLGETTSDVIQLHMTDSTTGYAVCSGSVAPFANGYVFKTIDGGSTWTQVYFDATTGLLGLAVADASTVYVGGGNQTIIKTTDGGTTWNPLYAGTSGYAIRAGFAVSSEVVYMVDDFNTIINTSDGGTTWNDTALVSTSLGLFSIYFPVPSIGFTADVSGYVYKLEACTPPASPDSISGLATVCSGATAEYGTNAVAGADSYNWSVPSDATILSGQGTTSILVSFGTQAGDVSVAAVSTACGAGSSIAVGITVNPSPAPVITFSSGVLSSSESTGNQWYYNGAPIGGATDVSYTPTLDGLYYVVVTNSFGCTGTSDTIDVVGVGIADPAAGSQVSVFPNPASGNVLIVFPKINSGKIVVYNSDGRKVYEQSGCSGTEINLDASKFSRGFYSLQIYTTENNLIGTTRFAVQ